MRPDFRPPLTFKANLGVQTRIPSGAILDVNLVTSQTRHNIRRADINQVTNLLGDWSGHGPKKQVVRYVRRAEAPVHDRDRSEASGHASSSSKTRDRTGAVPLLQR